MRFIAAMIERTRTLLRGRREDEELAEELRFHVERSIEAQMREGVDAQEAKRQAHLEFGGMDRIAEEVRDARRLGLSGDFVRDTRHAVRALVRQPGHAVAVLMTLAVGIGATTAVFSVVSALLLRPLPYPEAGRLVQMKGTSPLEPAGGAVVSHDVYRQESTSFDAMAGYEVSARYLTGGDEAERVMAVNAEPELFAVLDIAPALGRVFDATDDSHTVVVSDAFWRERLGSDPAAPGAIVTLDHQAYVVVGVMPPGFQFPYRAGSLLPGVNWESRTDLWLPLPVRPGGLSRIGNVTARLRPGVTIPGAQAELEGIAGALARTDPERHEGRSVRIMSLRDAVVPATVSEPLLLLLAAVAMVLILACVNVTNLSLVRGLLRGREIAIRNALGASRWRLVRQFVTESALLSLLGGGLGLALAWWATARVMESASTRIPRAAEVSLDWRVFAFLAGTCMLVTLLSGIVPGIAAARRDVRSVLQEAAGTATIGLRIRRLRDGLVVVEIALAFVLVIGALVLVREFAQRLDIDSGMDPRNVVTFHVGMRASPGDNGQRYYDLADRVSDVPGVRAAGFTQLLPLQNWGWTSSSRDFTFANQTATQPEFAIELRYVTPGYFHALGVTLRAGRFFSIADDASASPVIIINEALALAYFRDGDPVGQEMNRGRIVGVIGNVRQADLRAPAIPEIYYPIAQNWSQLSELGMSLVVRTEGQPDIPAIREAIREVDPGLAIFGIRTMDQVVRESLADLRLSLMVVVAFAAIALVLALTGTYGVIHRMAASRAAEFALRRALGAGRVHVVTLVLRHGMGLTAAGVAIGLLLAWAAAPVLERVSVATPGLDHFALTALAILVTAVLASLIPARRAVRTPPASILRS